MPILSLPETVFDSRDVIDRITELEADLEDLSALEPDDIDEMREELRKLTEFAKEGAENWPEWSGGVTIVNDAELVDYFKEYVSDISDMPRDLPSYIENNIDWDGVKDDLLDDYVSVEYDGETYWARKD